MSNKEGFAVWITGIPAAGKSAVTHELANRLRERGLPIIVLESDELRKILTPEPVYTGDERDRFYGQLAGIGELIVRSGANVIFDATANKRAYRDRARARIPRFVEVYVDCPREVCVQRDPKGIYAQAAEGTASYVPGLQTPYEAPVKPDVIVDGRNDPADNASLILAWLKQRFSV